MELFQDLTTGAAVLAILGTLLSLILGFVLGGFLSAACLRKSTDILEFDNIPFWRAFRIVLLINGILLAFSLSIGFNFGLSSGLFSKEAFESARQTFRYTVSPLFYIYFLFLSIIVTSAIFTRLVRKSDEEGTGKRIGFVDGLALSSVFFGISFGLCLAIVLIVGSLIALALAFT